MTLWDSCCVTMWRSSSSSYLEPLLSVQHAIVSTALFWRHHGPDLLFCGQPEVRLQHPPVRIHPWTEGTHIYWLKKKLTPFYMREISPGLTAWPDRRAMPDWCWRRSPVYLYVWNLHRVSAVSWCCSLSERGRLSLCPPCGFCEADLCFSRTDGKWTPAKGGVWLLSISHDRSASRDTWNRIVPEGSLWCECLLVWN